MDREGADTSPAMVIVAVLAIVVALFLGGMIVMFGPMMGGGGMMGGGTGWGWWGVAVLVLAVVVAVVALAIALRPSGAPLPAPQPPWSAGVPVQPPGFASPAPVAPTEESARIERLQEAAVVKALDEDERRLYLQIREGGGSALQRDLVASGAFSKAKVTRLLDKLERRGLVVRERYGATNRVKLTWKGPPTA